MDRAAGFDYEGDELIQMFRAALFLRGWRLARQAPWPALPLLLRWLLHDLIRQARQAVTRPAGDGQRPADDLSPPAALLRVDTLTAAPAAPPARVPCPAGTTG
ncbi:MAG: hypothetical protein ACRDOC_00680 [Streptosporangiaceae bacterium]